MSEPEHFYVLVLGSRTRRSALSAIGFLQFQSPLLPKLNNPVFATEFYKSA
jgi:hypothetical protein